MRAPANAFVARFVGMDVLVTGVVSALLHDLERSHAGVRQRMCWTEAPSAKGAVKQEW